MAETVITQLDPFVMQIEPGVFIWVGVGVLIIVGLYILLRATEASEFRNIMEQDVPKSKYGSIVGLDADVQNRVFAVTDAGCILGRDKQLCSVVSNNTAVSREHAQIIPIEGRVMLIDMRSKNGTYVNGKRISDYALQDGDVITLGKKRPTSFVYRR